MKRNRVQECWQVIRDTYYSEADVDSVAQLKLAYYRGVSSLLAMQIECQDVEEFGTLTLAVRDELEWYSQRVATQGLRTS